MAASMRMLIGSLLLVASLAAPAVGEQPLRQDHRRVMSYLDAAGNEQPVSTADDWAVRRRQIVSGMEAAMGPLPSRDDLPSLDVQITATYETDRYVHYSLTFLSEPGDRTAALLFVPREASAENPRPGIVALHPTGVDGKWIIDDQGRETMHYGRELAERGYVVIAPDYPSFGDSKDYSFGTDRYESGTMKGIWNHMRCVDLLQARADVRGDRIGVIGHSLGGHNALFHAAFDERVLVTVTSCGWTPFHEYPSEARGGNNLKPWSQECYMPRLASVYRLDPDEVPFDFYEVLAAIAPRALFSNSPVHDDNFDVVGVEKAAPVVRDVYKLLGATRSLRITTPNCDHNFPDAVRTEAYEFLDRHLLAD
jgi:pimeloyl-ACP methyl ester carboxylesterase